MESATAEIEDDSDDSESGWVDAHLDTSNAQRYVENLDGILKIQEQFLELADRYDVPIVDNVTVDASVMLVIRHVVETLRKSGNFDDVDLLEDELSQ